MRDETRERAEPQRSGCTPGRCATATALAFETLAIDRQRDAAGAVG